MTIYKETIGSGKDVVLIHGWCCDMRYMQPIAALLSEHYRVTMVDLPGSGRSDWDESINSVDDMGDLILPELPEQAIYIGWSIGGSIACSIASRYPHRVERVIGIATTPRFVEAEQWPGIPAPGFQIFFQEMNTIGVAGFMALFFEDEFVGQLNSINHQKVLALLHSLNYDKDVVQKGAKICDETDLRTAFKSIQCPIDFILGGQDESVNIRQIPLIQQLNQHAKIHLIKTAQHLPFWTHQAEFNAILSSLLLAK